MAYYPLSQIVTNLYTGGNEFTFNSDGSGEYVGYYWKNSKGEYYTGKTPQDTPISKLYPIVSPPDRLDAQVAVWNPEPIGTEETDLVMDYNNIKNVNTSQETYAPMYMSNPPTDKDYQTGEFRRYFCKKINETIYIEINKDQFDLLKNKDAKIAYEFYQPFDIPWRLTGDKTYVNNVNYNMVQLIMFRQKLPMFDMYLKEDYTKYYK
jgi:hypothetical protein